MTAPRHIAVIDIGKTNAKLALVDLSSLTEMAVVTRPNIVQPTPPYPHYDVDGHWAFLLDALAQFHRDHRVDAISVTTHGACTALLDSTGALAAPILDYEHTYPAEVVDAYDAIKPDFAQTGSPKLAGGLNIGAQLHWLFTTDPTLKERTAQIVTYPQYWGHRLTGVTATDVTSIGCHTDLWNPHKGTFSDLPAKLGVRDKIAPVRRPSDILGPILPEIAKATGLVPDTPVCVGIHDSNASLYPHVVSQNGPASVVSTGTWVIVMSMKAGGAATLDPARDTLVNVNAREQAVASARFMGGREYEVIQQGQQVDPTEQDLMAVLDGDCMLLPSVEIGAGPFQGRQMQWHSGEPKAGSGQRSAALSFYLALMTGTCLKLVGGAGPTIVEGPFARNPEYLAMLHAVTARPVLTNAAVTGTSIGAAMLFSDDEFPPELDQVETKLPLDRLRAYADLWSGLAGAE
ncbi:FGGY-family carbohydrate kinase [Aliiroseovarius subalbicans]|uniref:FGGY-family carbohydrate kinase n=1 Tax=Aliiroseovarius subalbicans TaxID=2925840 RepID=UPI001F57B756|nr:FGGY-family carbohydrate kinase [Aliiroseovarius subalbicans]MCI2399117.1 FGGY-family carbohydrate kinase [Aliiroseovarius subalbicans]